MAGQLCVGDCVFYSVAIYLNYTFGPLVPGNLGLKFC